MNLLNFCPFSELLWLLFLPLFCLCSSIRSLESSQVLLINLWIFCLSFFFIYRLGDHLHFYNVETFNSVLSSNLFLYLSTTLPCENLKGQNNLSYRWLTHLMILKLFWSDWTWLGSFQLHSMLFPMAVWSSWHPCLPVGLSSNCPHVNLFDNVPFNLPFCVCVCVCVCVC